MEEQRPSHLCPICRHILRPVVLAQPTAQTFEVFVDAVEKRCVICFVVWNLSHDCRHLWVASPQLWKPLQYRPYKDYDAASVINILVVYHKPASNQVAEVEFRLIPINDPEFQEQRQLPHVAAQVSPEATLALGQSWLANCMSSHPGCSQQQHGMQKWHPTRLVDVGTQDSAIWKVCLVAQDGVSPPWAEYLTLSYRWAPNPKILLTSSNVQELRQLGRPISTLPILFRDVIAVARHFRVRYIWIDALCIMQDSQADWEAEAPTMQHVYSNSSCNVAASASRCPDESLFQPRDVDMIRPGLVESSLFSSQSAVHYILDESYWDRQMLNSPLQNRGWVFQERFLAPRVLYFAHHQLLWECFTSHRCEVFPQGIPTHWSSADAGKMSYDTLRLWTDLVQQYSHCQLSKPSDKLFAMAGIAKLFQETTGDEYLAGLWRSRLPAMLDWRVHVPQPRQNLEHMAPSWSWASVGGLVRPYGISLDAELLVELISAQVVTRTPDPMSAAEGGSITLRGRLVRVVCRVAGAHLVSFEFMDRSPAKPRFSVQVFPDFSDTCLEQGSIVSCMPLKLDYYTDESDGSKRPHIFCLVLEQIPEEPECQRRYRRIGHFVVDSWGKTEMFCSGELSVFDIV
ncbi:heterokaryon incompatibility protein (HET) domain-containing protein [Hirsutella rhossiliensis]|uniref:Heterokaryon incompatibility protein (HET) domain-containing protein n=1 Tax=Hirsutella rhossiliensis TaxID=111463 RepID=A0A9P8SHF5_9HYPO|nr:heterokaryon incompatibility protein (HET) domain-containing protein [Hirsutella rhossiliensis]KAH0961490.1 heterokaryon incompatibility protein (HET) domain-containing protein [Hirsutella rhossiliensis]